MRPCLPRCFNPVFPDPCDLLTGETVCCIEWTMPCEGGSPVTVHFDWPTRFGTKVGSYVKPTGSEGGESCFGYVGADEFDFCFNSVTGSIMMIETPIDFVGTDNEVSLVLNGRGTKLGGSSFKSVVDWEDNGCPTWPSNLTEWSGLDETLTIGEFEYTRQAIPGIRWFCTTGGVIQFEVGWAVFYVGPLDTGCSTPTIFYDGFTRISWDTVPANWYETGASFELANSRGTGGDTFRSTVTPVLCAYEPCGDPLDCFAACISGTKDCDGETPAHVPVIYFTLIKPGCCLAGTHALTFGGLGGYGYKGSVTCVDIFGVKHVMKIVVNCGASAGSPADDGGPGALVYLHLDFDATYPDPGGFTDHVHYDLGFSQSCSGGDLASATGTVAETFCGFFGGSADWAVHT